MVQSWGGFYIGGHGGYGWKDDPFSFSFGDTTIGGIHAHGWMAGGQVGYNWQYGSMVGGLELDASATGIRGSASGTTGTPGLAMSIGTYGDDIKLLGSARGRLGFAPSPDWLLYGTGGLGWERTDQTFSSITTATPPLISQTQWVSQPVDLFGWVLGVGVEARIAQSNWIARLEYLHYDFGHSRTANVLTGPVNLSFSDTVGNQTIDVVRAGLSFKFGG